MTALEELHAIAELFFSKAFNQEESINEEEREETRAI